MVFQCTIALSINTRQGPLYQPSRSEWLTQASKLPQLSFEVLYLCHSNIISRPSARHAVP